MQPHPAMSSISGNRIAGTSRRAAGRLAGWLAQLSLSVVQAVKSCAGHTTCNLAPACFLALTFSVHSKSIFFRNSPIGNLSKILTHLKKTRWISMKCIRISSSARAMHIQPLSLKPHQVKPSIHVRMSCRVAGMRSTRNFNIFKDNSLVHYSASLICHQQNCTYTSQLRYQTLARKHSKKLWNL